MLPIGWGIEGYIELKLDWKGSLDAMAAAVTDEVGGVGPGVRGESDPVPPTPPFEGPFKTLLSVPLWDVAPLPPLLLLLFKPPSLESVVPPELPPPPPLTTAPVVELCDGGALGSRFWLRSFSSRRHLALRFENQTWRFLKGNRIRDEPQDKIFVWVVNLLVSWLLADQSSPLVALWQTRRDSVCVRTLEMTTKWSFKPTLHRDLQGLAFRFFSMWWFNHLQEEYDGDDDYLF